MSYLDRVNNVYLVKKYLEKDVAMFSDKRQRVIDRLRDRLNLLHQARKLMVENFNFDFVEDLDQINELISRTEDNLAEWRNKNYQFTIYHMQQVLLDLDIDQDSFSELNKSIELNKKIINDYK